jgi:Xaa-Pro dipeptidase
MDVAVHFTEGEFSARCRAVVDLLCERGLDGLLVFRQESMYYLTGYDTFGYCFFQCMFLGADGTLTLLTRSPDLRQARHTSIIRDIRIWGDAAGKDPALDLRALLAEFGCKGGRLGIEFDAYGLTAHNWRRVEAALDGFCVLSDASDVVSRLRAVKSEQEMEYVRRAAELADEALGKAVELAGPGVYEGEILAEMQGAIFRGGGDYPGNEFIIGSGDDALLCRYFSGRRTLASQDQLTIEFAGAYRHYHSCLMRTIVIGTLHREHRAMHDACVEAMHAAMEALRPGEPVGKVFDAHARAMDAAGYATHRLNACGYGLGTTFTPTWMDWPMLYTGNAVLAQPNMVFHLHMILMNSDAGRAMTLGQTAHVTETGSESLNRQPLDLVVK